LAATELLRATLYDDSDFNSASLFNSRPFSPSVPRGCTAKLKKAWYTWGPDDAVAATDEYTNFFGLVKGRNHNNKPIALLAVNSIGIHQVTSNSQRGTGTPADVVVDQVGASSSFDYQNDPSRFTEIRQTGPRSNSEDGWSILWWASGTALNIYYLATIEFEITYLDGSGNPGPLDPVVKLAVLNQ